MKIGFYGNANNYPFMLARAMQRLGHEVVFVVASPETLNRPEHRYPDISVPYPPWIVDASHRFRWHCLVPGLGRDGVFTHLNACDAVILNEEGPALARHLKVPYGVLLTGSDIAVFADPTLAKTLKPQAFDHPRWARELSRRFLPTSFILRKLVLPQRAGIESSRFVAFLPKGLVPTIDLLLTDIGVRPSQRAELLFTDCELAPYVHPPVNTVVRIFSATRMTWLAQPGTDLTPLDLKGSDVMLRGLAMFLSRMQAPLDIHLVKKGRHLKETMTLAAELGLARQITWHEEMSQKDVLQQFQLADIVLEQFGSSAVGIAGLDAMATGRPLIANGRPEILERVTSHSSPILQATSPEEICAHLQRIVPAADLRIAIGRASRAYVQEFFSSETAARTCMSFFHSKGNLTCEAG